MSPDDVQNFVIANAPALSLHHGLNAFKISEIQGRVIYGRAKQLIQLNDPKLGELDGIYVERPTEVTIEFTSQGSLERVRAEAPSPDEVADAVNFVCTLVQGGRIAHIDGSKGTTHAVQIDPSGRSVLVRQRYASC